MYFAKLIHGKKYHILNKDFHKGEEVKIDKKLFDVLKGNSSFQVREEIPVKEVVKEKENRRKGE